MKLKKYENLAVKEDDLIVKVGFFGTVTKDLTQIQVAALSTS